MRRTPSGTLVIVAVLAGSLRATHEIATEAQDLHPSALDSGFDAYVQSTQRDWKAPGVLIAVVKDGRPVFIKGYGTRRFGADLPIDEQTLVTIASVTKAFTATALAMLADEGRLTWDDPVKEHIPDFWFANEYTSRHTTVRDLLLHRVGFPNAPGDINNPDYTLQDLLADLRSISPTTGFRERLDYSQVGYALAGEIIARASGMPWDEFVTRRILEPLGMSSSYATPSRLEAARGDPNHAENIFIRAVRRDGAVVDDGWFGIDHLYAPGGSIVSTGADIARWMILQLQGGRFDSRSLVSAAQVLEMQRPQMLENIEWARLEDRWWAPLRAHFAPLTGVGLGWYAFDYRGHRVVEHAGALAGTSILALVPAERLGVFVTTNAFFPDSATNHMVDALKLKVIDRFIGAPDTDWSAEFRRVHSNW